jgi:thioredoxin reductase (NADPH)
MIHCAARDASLYAGKVVAVCGGGRAGVVEALLLANHASKVFLIEAEADLSAFPALKDNARAHPKLEIRCSEKPVEVRGDQYVTGVEVVNSVTGRKELLAVDGVLVHVGFEADTGYLRDVIALDESNRVTVNPQFETEAGGIFAAGDIRGGSPIGVASALSDGATAATSAQQYLEGTRAALRS